MQLEKAGLFSFVTYGWLTLYMKEANKHGLKPESIPVCLTSDSCELTAQRYSIRLMLFMNWSYAEQIYH